MQAFSKQVLKIVLFNQIKLLVKRSIAYISFMLIVTACNKDVVTSGSSATTGSNAYLSLTVADSIPPYKNFVVVLSNGNLITSLGFLNTTGYYNIVSGITDIKLQSQTTGALLFDTTVTLASGSINTAFAFTYGNTARTTVVQENYNTPTSGYAKVRLLDLWNGIGTNIANFTISDGTNTFVFSKRYFLDHEKDHTLENFIAVPASNYTLYVTFGTTLIINPFGFNLLDGKIYTIAITDVRNGLLISPVIPHN